MEKTKIPVALDSGYKFDLDQWDEEYFDRWENILQAAGDQDIELEIVLHGPLHMSLDQVELWGVCPLNSANNINDINKDIDYCHVLTLKDKDLVEVMDRYMIKLIRELNAFDNLHYECMNEPYTYTDMATPGL